MDQKDLEYFRNLLTNMLEEAQKKGDTTLEELSGTSENFADPADRATAESDRAFTLRIRDRERRLIKKVKEALQRIDDGTYGICEECGEEISLSRLKARPVTRLCINCKAKKRVSGAINLSGDLHFRTMHFNGMPAFSDGRAVFFLKRHKPEEEFGRPSFPPFLRSLRTAP